MKKLPLYLLFTLPALTAHAAVTSIASGNWESGATWSDSNPAGPTNDYSIETGHTVTTPNSATATFTGNSLNVQSGGTLELYRDIGGNSSQGISASIPNLTIAGGTLRSRVGFATGVATLSSSLIFDGGGNIEVGTTFGTFSHTFNLNGSITGNGDVSVFRTNQGSGRALVFGGDLSTFSGNWDFTGGTSSSDILNVNLETATNGWGSGNIEINEYVSFILNTGDINQNGSITMAASNATFNLGSNSTTVNGFAIGANTVADGTYNASDLGALGFGGNFTGSGSLTITSIPEPSTSGLLIACSAALIIRRRR